MFQSDHFRPQPLEKIIPFDPTATPNNAVVTKKSRPYQEDLLKIVLEKNTIIYLPTGSGKTHIAIMAMQHLAKGCFNKSLSRDGKRTIFIVNSIILANQQADFINKETGFKTSIFTGEQKLKNKDWFKEFDKTDVIIATCQVIVNIFHHGKISMKNINLIVFDECHHGRRDHPMHQLMKLYMDVLNECDKPRIIGLTGMLIGCSVKSNTVKSELEVLENTFHSTIATVNSYGDFENVLLYSTNPTEYILKFTEDNCNLPSNVHAEIIKNVEEMIQLILKCPIEEKSKHSHKFKGEISNAAKFLKNILLDFTSQLNDLGTYGGWISISSTIVEFQQKQKCATTYTLKNLLEKLIKYAKTIQEILLKIIGPEIYHDYDTILNHSTIKLQTLCAYLEKYYDENGIFSVKTLIFVQRRFTAKCIYHILKRLSQRSPYTLPIKVGFIVGSNSEIYEQINDQNATKCKNQSILNRFRLDEINLIVASDVLEEGVDLQMCNLVISYDLPQTFRSYIQSKGRARMKDSTYILMSSRNNFSKLVNAVSEFRATETILKECLIGKAINRPPPNDYDIQKEFDKDFTESFYTLSGAVLDSQSAIQILNHYCMKLLTRYKYGTTLEWKKKTTKKGIVVTVTLPSMSSITEPISSDPMPSTLLAKRSASFKTCHKLYQNGELNDNLMY